MGASAGDVAEADKSFLEYKTSGENNLYDPQNLLDGITYYWRVDAVTDRGTVKGDVWSFTLEGIASTVSSRVSSRNAELSLLHHAGGHLVMSFCLLQRCRAHAELLDLSGRTTRVLMDRHMNAGQQRVAISLSGTRNPPAQACARMARTRSFPAYGREGLLRRETQPLSGLRFTGHGFFSVHLLPALTGTIMESVFVIAGRSKNKDLTG